MKSFKRKIKQLFNTTGCLQIGYDFVDMTSEHYTDPIGVASNVIEFDYTVSGP